MNKLDKSYSAIVSKHHTIFPLKFTDNFPAHFWVLDTEDDSKGNITLLVIKSNKGNKFIIQNTNPFKIKTEFRNLINTNPDIKIVYAHNLGYDLNNTFGRDWIFYNPIMQMSNPLQITYKYNKKKIIFKDSYSILLASVKNLGIDIGLDKIKTDNFNDIDYCERDCDIVIKSLERLFYLLSTNKIPYKLTLPSTFYSYFRAGLKDVISRCNYNNFVRYAYKGGRTEVFKSGKQQNIKIYDLNSLYPFIMQSSNFPDPSKAIKENILRNSKNNFQIILALIKQNSYIPVCGIKEKKLIFPNGLIKGFFTNIELEYMLQNNLGTVEEIYTGLTFNYLGFIFTDIINKLYQLRKESKSKFDDRVFKRIMNGGYGKFGQSNKVIELDTKELVFKEVIKDNYPAQSNYIWSILITSLARLRLHKFMLLKKDSLCYCDTDSIHLTNDTLDKKYISNELGQWKLEGTFKHAVYKSAKCYSLTDLNGKTIYRVKGVPNSYQKNFFELGKTSFQKPVKIRSYLRDSSLPLNFWESVIKKQQSGYDKRIVLENNTTLPLTLNFKGGDNNAEQLNRCFCGVEVLEHESFCSKHYFN